MSSTTSTAATPSSSKDPKSTQNVSAGTFFASLSLAFALFGVQVIAFLLLKGPLRRIYQPRTYLVPERERTTAPPRGLWQWLISVFKTSNSDFIQKCGLDAYFFLRYLRTLLRIFVPLALILIPVLIPLNLVGGNSEDPNSNVKGLDTLAWGNVKHTSRYWAHFILAILVIGYTCYVFFDELRGFVRLRQAYLTSAEHRLRASATTVLVSSIPAKWCTFEALDGLYDVFPGGIRNIWINRNFDALNDKVKQRDSIAKALESAETSLIRNARKSHLKQLKKEAKKSGNKSSDEKKGNRMDEQGARMANSGGISSGNPHQVHHTVEEELRGSSVSLDKEPALDRNKPLVPIPIVGQGIEAVGQGFDKIGKTVFRGLKRVGNDVDGRLKTTGGLALDDPEVSNPPRMQESRYTARPHEPHDASMHGSSPTTQQTPPGSSTRQGTSTDSGPHTESRTDHDNPSLPTESPPPHGLDGPWYDDIVKKGRGEHSAGENVKRQSSQAETHSNLKFWKKGHSIPFGIPSPTPHMKEEDEFPLSSMSPVTPTANRQATINGKSGNVGVKVDRVRSGKEKDDGTGETEYPSAYDKAYQDNDDGEPVWKKYLKEKDRDTMRLPIFGWQWMLSLPLLGQKVDTIDHCRRELARLNLEIELDQSEPEKFPLMNSAFVQFNHQVAAHMACQAVSHHTPNQMTPRLVEISPNDVIWDNMSIKWWERYIRRSLVVAVIAGLIIGWAFPVAFTGALARIDSLREEVKWLAWLKPWPQWLISIIQGVLPPSLLALLLVLLPIVFRFLCRIQGEQTGMNVELEVQNYYFLFLFVQVFLIATISGAVGAVLSELKERPQSVPKVLAQNLPKVTNYFFSYLLLQALSVSASALLQLGGLFKWFILSPLMDSTARQKWKRQVTLPDVNWGSFFPVYTNLAAIGLIYSVIAPLILVFNILTFGLFWIVYRYNTLYVTKFRFDTGGLLYPRAINQLFSGLYFMEGCLIGLFFLVRGADGAQSCKGQAIGMIVATILTAGYQIMLNHTFSPLFRYLPITLEDEAVMRDEEFARAQEKRWKLDENEQDGDDINDVLSERARRSEEESRQVEVIELQQIEARKERGRLDPRNIGNMVDGKINKLLPNRKSWADRSNNPVGRESMQPGKEHRHHRQHSVPQRVDEEAQTAEIGEALFSGIHDEIEDLTPEDRDRLVQRAFQHTALRARRPVIWIPRDDLGISDDEIRRTQKMTKYIWISNEGSGLDAKSKVIYKRSPPDFSEVDLIEL